MRNACRKRALTVTGATISTVGVILVAVYGPALAAAVAAIGASGGVWGIINAVADNNIRAIKQDSWYYVWALSEASSRTEN
jgi:membrane associated rhomboid family serine protease